MISHANTERASKAVARGKKPEKKVRCKIERVWHANPPRADHNPIGQFSEDEPSRKMKKLTDETRYNITALLKKIRSKVSSC